MNLTPLESSALLEYFRELGWNHEKSEKSPELNEQDAKTLLRHRAMCAVCSGLDNCKERGCVMRLSFAADKKTARVSMDWCSLKKARDTEQKSKKLFLGAAIPPALQKCSLENYVTGGQGESAERAKSAAARAIDTCSSLVLAGDVGTGKTHLAAAVVNAALFHGNTALFISAIGYLERLKSTFEKKQAELYAEMVDLVKSVDCLAIDDLGAEKPSAWTIARLYDVINARVERGCQTIVTTNYPTAYALIKRFGADAFGGRRIASRLISFGWLTIDGEDYRRKKADA